MRFKLTHSHKKRALIPGKRYLDKSRVLGPRWSRVSKLVRKKEYLNSKKQWWKTVLKRFFIFSFITFLFFALLGTIFASAYISRVSREIPDPGTPFATEFIPQTTYIYDRDGKVELYKIYGDRNSEWVKIEDIPPHVRAAFLAAEDASFYQHKGMDLPGIGKAILHELFGIGSKRGASTITQQLIQNATSVGREQSYKRKVKELILSMQIEQKYTKDQILEAYLNYIPFGGNIYGIKVASKAYFGKEPKDLTLAEAALLAGIPQFPATYAPPPRGMNPLLTAYQAHIQCGFPYDPDAWLAENIKDEDLEKYGITDRKDYARPANEWRMEYVLYQIKDKRSILSDPAGCNCGISDEQIEEARKQQIVFTKYYERKLAGHFVDYVRTKLDEMFKDKGGISYVESAGLKVYTTLDWDMQQIGEEEVKNIRGSLKNYNAYNAALVSVDPNTGEILTMVGSRDYWGENEGCDSQGRCKFNGQTNALISLRSYGSSGKPFVYLAFFMKGFGTGSIVPDIPLKFGNYAPQNYDRTFLGLEMDVRRALELSRNVPAVEALSAVGMDDFLNLISKIGYSQETVERMRVAGLASAIGGASITMLEHANAYIILATGGIYRPLVCIKKIVDRDGKVIYEYVPDEGTRVVEEKYTYLVTDILQNYWTLPPVKKYGYYVAGKTGTSDGPRDIVFAGYTKHLVTVVWAGNNDNSPMRGDADGSTVAKGIWNPYMLRVLPKFPNEPFKQPAGVLRISVCRDTGFSPGNSGCPTKTALFVTPPPEDTFHKKLWVSRCPDVYKLASEADKLAGVAEEKLFVHYQAPNPALQPQLDDYLSKKGLLPPTEVCDMYRGENAPIMKFTTPTENQVFHVGDTVNISVQIGTPKGIVSVDFYTDDMLIKHATFPPYSAQWTIDNNVTAGSHTVKAEVLDTGGKKGVGIVKIFVEKQLPTIRITDPINNAVVLKPTMNVTIGVGSTPLVTNVSVDIFVKDESESIYKLCGPFDIAVGSSKTVNCNISGLSSGKGYYIFAKSLVGVDPIQSEYVYITVSDPS